MTDPAFDPPAPIGTPPPVAMATLAQDYLELDWLFTPQELVLRDRVRAFVDERIRPNIAQWYESATFPRELAKELGALGLLGMHLHGYGCAGRSAVESGLAALELEAGDSGIRTFVSVQGSLAMSAVAGSAPRSRSSGGCPA
jgi:glutaryl-CoA dehydrogenase